MSQAEITACDHCGDRVEREGGFNSTPPHWWNISVFRGLEPGTDPEMGDESSGWYADYCQKCAPDVDAALALFAAKYGKGFD